MIISFDLTGVFCLIIIPPVIVYLCKLAWELATITKSNFLLRMQTKYRNENIALVKEINQLIKENGDLKKELSLND